jgi:hypothetical protein
MLEKKVNLRKLEFTFSDDMLHKICHFEYAISILEDGQEISRSNHREIKDCEEGKKVVMNCKIRENE